MRPAETLPNGLPEPSAQVLMLLRLRLWKASPLAAGRFLLDQARQARSELRGQRPGVPDLSEPASGFDIEGLLVWEVLPEIARRLMKQDGVAAMIAREERQAVPCDHIPDADLRAWTGSMMLPERFAAAAEILRAHPEALPRQSLRPFAIEILGTPFACGNAVEIASAKLSGVAEGRHPPADPMSHRMAALGEDLAPGRGWRSWSPAFGSAMAARHRSGPPALLPEPAGLRHEDSASAPQFPVP